MDKFEIGWIHIISVNYQCSLQTLVFGFIQCQGLWGKTCCTSPALMKEALTHEHYQCKDILMFGLSHNFCCRQAKILYSTASPIRLLSTPPNNEYRIRNKFHPIQQVHIPIKICNIVRSSVFTQISTLRAPTAYKQLQHCKTLFNSTT